MDRRTDLTFCRLGPEGHEAAAEVLARSFAEETMFKHLLGEDIAHDWKVILPFMRAMVEAHAPLGPIDAALVDGRVAGVSVTMDPEHFPIGGWGVVRISLQVLPAGLRLALTRPGIFRLFQAGSAMEKFHPRDEPTFYLAFFGVAPEFRSAGVAHKLAARVLGHVDERDVGCYLDTAGQATKRMCHMLGFRVHHQLQPFGPDGPTFYGMWRPPKSRDAELRTDDLSSAR